VQRRRRASPLVFNSGLVEERTRWLGFSGQLPDTFSFLVPIKEHIEEWNNVNADPGTQNAEHKIDFLIAWTIDERKDGVAAFCPYVSQRQKEENVHRSEAYHRQAHEGFAQAKISFTFSRSR
jgi:hypothetical protein